MWDFTADCGASRNYVRRIHVFEVFGLALLLWGLQQANGNVCWSFQDSRLGSCAAALRAFRNYIYGILFGELLRLEVLGLHCCMVLGNMFSGFGLAQREDVRVRGPGNRFSGFGLLAAGGNKQHECSYPPHPLNK